jgi:hypothetical protein
MDRGFKKSTVFDTKDANCDLTDLAREFKDGFPVDLGKVQSFLKKVESDKDMALYFMSEM